MAIHATTLAKSDDFGQRFSPQKLPAFGVFCTALMAFAIAISPLARAQSTSATLNGQITDPTGKVVPGTAVSAVNIDTNITYPSRTNDTGIYVIPNLPPGRYRLVVSHDGFKQINKTDITLNVQDDLEQNFSLEVGSTSESVTVEGSGVNINTTDGSVSTVIDRQFVENLPLNGRSFNGLLQLTPGVVQGPEGFNINGQRGGENYYTVDGVSANFGVGQAYGLNQAAQGPALTSFGGTNSLLSIDALQEFRIQTSSFAPEYGRTPGGQIEVTTRSGTNSFHGDLFDYFRNNALDANDWFYDQALGTAAPGTLSQPQLRQNDFGGVFGGRIVKDRTFFFSSYEGLRLVQPQVQYLYVPDSQSRQSVSAPLNALLNAFPLPNGPDQNNGFAAFTQTSSTHQALDSGSLRMDQVIGSKFMLFGRASYAASSSNVPTYNQLAVSDYPTWLVTAGMNAQLSPALGEQLRLNYSSSKSALSDKLAAIGGGIIPNSLLFLPAPYNADPFALFLSSDDFVNFASYTSGPSGKFFVNQFDLVQDLSWTIRRHALKFGFDLRSIKVGQNSPSGGFLFAPTVSDLVQGGTSVFEADSYASSHVKAPNWSLYGQDTWRLGQRIAITYGLRWDVNPGPSGTDGTLFVVPQNLGTPSNLTAGPAKQLWGTKYGNVAPRVGIALKLRDRLTLRSGVGIFYDLASYNVGSSAINYPFSDYSDYFGFFSLPLGDPSQYLPPLPLTPPFTNSDTLFLTDPNLALPHSLQWNAAGDYQLGQSSALSVTYVGQAGRRLLQFEQLSSPNSNFHAVAITKNGGRSNYDALQVQYRQRMNHGLQLLANYTWSHSLDDASSNASNGGSFALLAAEQEYGNSTFDVRHNFSSGLTYDFPQHAENRILKQFAAGWGVDSIIYARTGLPIDVVQGNPNSQFVPFHDSRPNQVPGQPFWIADHTAPGGKKINVNAFTLRPPGQQGDLPRNAVPGFGFTQWDATTRKSFLLTENARLLFRLDFFNILNHPNFANPAPFFHCATGGSQQCSISDGQPTSMLNNALPGISSIYQNGGPRSLQASLKLQF